MTAFEKMIIAMIQNRHVRDRSTQLLRQNRAIIAVSVITAARRQVENIKNHEDAVQVVAVIAVAIHATPTDHVNIRDANVPRPMIEQVDRAKAATNVISIREIKVTLEVIATKRVVVE